MKRFLMKDLVSWKDRADRKPLIIRGARQVGKTWLMQAFGKEYFDKTVYINFDRERRLHDLLQTDIGPANIIMALEALTGSVIHPENTLIIFDEIQEEPRALTALKYFCEEAPQYAVISAGSLLGVALHKGTSFPVGKVEFLDLYPLHFREFLVALGKEPLERILSEKDTRLMTAMKSEYIDALRLYYFTGGMPEVVNHYITHRDITKVRNIQEDLISFYRQDFSKHAAVSLVPRLNQVWDSIPAQLAKENRKYIYGQLYKGARAKDFELAIQWLSDCGLIHLVHRVSKPGIPLKYYEELSAFKIFMNDIGLFGAMSGLSLEAIVEKTRIFSECRGAMTEQYVLQQIVSDMKETSYYYSAENSRGEIDFLLQNNNGLLPIEVKAEENLRSKSLKAFCTKYECDQAVRISMSDYRQQDWIVNLPLYGFMKLM